MLGRAVYRITCRERRRHRHAHAVYITGNFTCVNKKLKMAAAAIVLKSVLLSIVSVQLFLVDISIIIFGGVRTAHSSSKTGFSKFFRNVLLLVSPIYSH
jgi:hypothetical protein